VDAETIDTIRQKNTTMAGVSDWHKQQRKKELKKNKDARLAARNERVLVEKSIPGIRSEIAKLEASLKTASAGNPQHTTQMKVDRLKKELKLLLQKEAEETSNNKSKPAAHSARPLPPVHAPLADPRVSIYYDAVLNPFGEPPPNRPRLFHRRGGGTTLTLREAVVPGEEPEPNAAISAAAALAPSPPSRTDAAGGRTNDGKGAQAQTTTNKRVEQVSAARSREENNGPQQQKRGKPPPAKKAKLTSSSAVPQHDKVAEAPPPVMAAATTAPKSMPALPAASASVQRSKKLTVDIWASNLELEYEYDSWEYRDQLNQAVQGPYSTQQMQHWIIAGHFPATTLVRPVHADEWKKLGQIKELWNNGHTDDTKKKKKRKEPVDDPSTDVQQRIALLRQQQQQQQPSHDESIAVDDDNNNDDDVQSRIARLRADAADVAREPIEQVAAATTTIELIDEPNRQAGVTLEQGHAQPHHHSVSTGLPLPPPSPPPALRSSACLELPLYPTPPLPSMPLPPPPPAPSAAGRNIDEDLPCYPIDIMMESTMDLPAYPLLPSSSSELMEEDDANMVVAPYPMLTGDKPDGGDVADAPIPLTNIRSGVLAAEASSPSVCTRQPERHTVPRPGLKSAIVDKSVVAFLPTALRRKHPQ
jgi:hypothetical protein